MRAQMRAPIMIDLARVRPGMDLHAAGQRVGGIEDDFVCGCKARGDLHGVAEVWPMVTGTSWTRPLRTTPTRRPSARKSSVLEGMVTVFPIAGRWKWTKT